MCFAEWLDSGNLLILWEYSPPWFPSVVVQWSVVQGSLFQSPESQKCGSTVIFCVLQSEACGLCFLCGLLCSASLFWFEGLGVEEGQNWLIILVKRGTTQTDQEGFVNLAYTLAWALEGRYGLKDCISEEMNTSLCRVGWSHGDQAISSVGILSARVELTSPTSLPTHYLNNLMRPTISWFD